MYWLESCRTHNYILLAHLRIPQPGGPSPRTAISAKKLALTLLTSGGRSVSIV
jgi:hypothetical protein